MTLLKRPLFRRVAAGRYRRWFCALVGVGAAAFAADGRVLASPQGQGGPSPQERAAVIKQSLEESQKRLRQYEWIETTVISLKGEEKSRRQNRCYYGADGKLQKVPLSAEPPPQGGGGRRGRIVQRKKDELADYMERARNLIELYLPPNPALIQAARDRGSLAVRPPAGGRARIEFNDYLQPRDLLALDVDVNQNRLAGVTVATYLGTADDPVSLNATMGALNDGTIFTAESTLDAKAKNVRVVVQNSGYRLVGR